MPFGDLVEGPIERTPSRVVEEIDLCAVVLVHEIPYTDPDQTDRPVPAGVVPEPQSDPGQLEPVVGRSSECLAPGEERVFSRSSPVRELQLEYDRGGQPAVRAQASGDGLGMRPDGLADHRTIHLVAGKRVLFPVRTAPSAGNDGSGIEAAGEGAGSRGEGTERALEVPVGCVGEVSDRSDPDARQACSRGRTDSPDAIDRKRPEKALRVAGSDLHQAIGFRKRARDLGHEAAGADSNGDREPGGLANPSPDPFADPACPAEEAQRAGDVEIGLVERERFDHRRELAKDPLNDSGHFRVSRHAAGEEDPAGAEPARFDGGHRGVHAESPGLVGGRRDHTPRAGPSHDDRPSAELRVVVLFDRGVEGVEIRVQDRPRAVHGPILAVEARNASRRRARFPWHFRVIRSAFVAYYGVFLDLRGRSCRVIGGGRIALGKVEGLLAAGARVRVISPEVVDQLEVLVDGGDVEWLPRAWRRGDLAGAFLAIAATDDSRINREVAAEAERLRIPVNVVDVKRLCSFIAPATLQRGDLQIAVSTGGGAPALAGIVRDRIADLVGPEYETTVAILQEARRRLRESAATPEQRRETLLDLARSRLPEHVRNRDLAAIEGLLVDALGDEAWEPEPF